MKLIPKLRYKWFCLKEHLKSSIVLGEEARHLRGVQWALFKLDDKPHQSWSLFLGMAKYYNDLDSVESCEKFLKMGLTIQEIEERCKNWKDYNEPNGFEIEVEK